MICNFDEKLSVTPIQIIYYPRYATDFEFYSLSDILIQRGLSDILIQRGWEEREGLFIHNPMCNIPGSDLCCQKIPFSFYKALYTVALFSVLQNL